MVVAVVAVNPKIYRNVKSFAFEILIKPVKILSAAKGYFKRIKDLSDENLLLKQRIAGLSVAIARTDETGSENKRLKALLDFKRKLHYRTVAARVIGRDPSDWRRAIIVNKGRRHGIKKRMSCATPRGFIGTVVEVEPSTSKIMLITDPNSKIGVVIEPSRETCVLTGSEKGLCRAIYLSLDGKVAEGDSVLTGGFSEFIPKDLVAGEVTDVGIEKAKLYRYAIVKPVEDMNRIEEVICIDTEGWATVEEGR